MDLEALQRQWGEYLTWRRRPKRRRRAAVTVLRVSPRNGKLYLSETLAESVGLAKEKDALMDMGRELGCVLEGNCGQPLAA